MRDSAKKSLCAESVSKLRNDEKPRRKNRQVAHATKNCRERDPLASDAAERESTTEAKTTHEERESCKNAQLHGGVLADKQELGEDDADEEGAEGEVEGYGEADVGRVDERKRAVVVRDGAALDLLDLAVGERLLVDARERRRGLERVASRRQREEAGLGRRTSGASAQRAVEHVVDELGLEVGDRVLELRDLVGPDDEAALVADEAGMLSDTSAREAVARRGGESAPAFVAVSVA